jgi:hypothetical protein
MEIVGIKQSQPPYDCWRLTFNGKILGDSRGYPKARAIEEARKEVRRFPDLYTLDEAIK